MTEYKIKVKKDALWKDVIKTFFQPFMDFFYPIQADKIDFTKEIIFLDKELDKINRLDKQKDRRADLLVKVNLKSGKSSWLLIHVEVQGYKDEFFAKRMFQMNYRIFEQLNIEVVGFAILTDNDVNFHPTFYEYGGEFWNSKMRYEFKTYKLLKQNPKKIEKSKNPFAIIMKAAWLNLYKNQPKTDEDRLKTKLKLSRELLALRYEHPKIQKLFDFIRFYTYFNKSKFYDEFEIQFNELTKNQKQMTIEEAILEEYEKAGEFRGIQKGEKIGIQKGEKIGIQKGEKIGIQKGEKIGIQKGEKIGIQKGEKIGIQKGFSKAQRIGITNMLKKGFDILIIVDVMEVSEEEVKAIQQEMIDRGVL